MCNYKFLCENCESEKINKNKHGSSSDVRARNNAEADDWKR